LHTCTLQDRTEDKTMRSTEATGGHMPEAAAEQALWHARLIVSAMKENEGVALDFSPESVRHLDALLKMLHMNGLTVERVPKILFQTGCYLGQVVVNACPGSRWMHPGEVDPPLDAADFPDPVVVHPGGVVWAPIARAVNVLRDPARNSLLESCLGEIGRCGPAMKF
jgi:hypothetical protein